MTNWGVPPVEALLDTDAGPHRIVWDGDTIVLTKHDESDAVLDALGSPSCVCYAVAAGWSELRSEPSTLLPLFDPPPTLAPGIQELVEIERFLLGESTEPPIPASLRKPGDFRHHRVKDAFLAVIPLLPPEFRTALLRAAVDDLQAEWDDHMRRPEIAAALGHIVLVALRRSLPDVSLHDVNIAMSSDANSVLSRSADGSIALQVGKAWIGDIAAQDNVAEWWGRALDYP